MAKRKRRKRCDVPREKTSFLGTNANINMDEGVEPRGSTKFTKKLSN